MASRTVFWRWLIEEHRLAVDFATELVTTAAVHISVRSLKWETGFLVVIEQRRSPSAAVVAITTCRNAGLRELPAVDIHVTLFTF